MKKTLTLAQKLTAGAMSVVFKLKMGFVPAILPVMLKSFGVRKTMRIFATMDKCVQALATKHGAVNAQAMLGLAATRNGCLYCSIGHLYAANVLHFKETGQLHPLSEQLPVTWRDMTDREMLSDGISRLTKAGAEFEPLARLIKRQHALQIEGDAIRDEDDLLVDRVLGVWDLIGACTILLIDERETLEVPPMTDVAKDTVSIRRYRQARDAASH